MSRRTISLFRRIESALETIARGSTPLETILETAKHLVENFSTDLGLVGGRIYERDDDGDYVLVATFGRTRSRAIGRRIPRSYPALERLLDEGSVVMSLSDGEVDRRLEAELGTGEQFASIVVADGAFALAFDVVPGPGMSEDLVAALNIVRFAINQKLREERMMEILEEARRIQGSILPHRTPVYGDFRLAARSIPAEVVGGDFYDFITLTDETFNVVVADATGHGLPAALQVRDIFMGLRMGLTRDYKLTRTLERLNGIIHRSRLATKFVSLILAEVDVGGTVMYCNAGHPPGLLVRVGGDVEYLRTGGMILGPRRNAHYTVDLVRMEPGDLLALYTDGITETSRGAMEEEEFSVGRLARLLRDHRTRTPAELVDLVFEAVREFSGREHPVDDQTLVVLKREISGPEGGKAP